jgi:adenosylcobinamide kinase/adenosylcobinamide-phosphate guanylyltransferase
MGLVVITGGARSGKSGVASRLAARCTGEVTVVVFANPKGDPEMTERVRRHREDRPEDWHLIEARTSVEWTDTCGSDTVVVDCLGSLLSMVMEETLREMGGGPLAGASELPNGYEAHVQKRFAPIVGWLLRRIDHTIVVTNEVGEGVVPPYPSGRVFRDVLGRANRSLVERAEKSYLVVAGRLIELTHLPSDAVWPWHEKGCD